MQSLRQKDIWNNDISQEEADFNLGFGISGIAAGPASRIGGRFINNTASRFFNSGIAGIADDIAAVTDDLAAATATAEEFGTAGVLNPKDIHFMQSSIKNTTGEFTVLGNAESLSSGTLEPSILRMYINNQLPIPVNVNWKVFANILMAAKMYE